MMSNGKTQRDWDLHSFTSFWATAAYQKKTFDIYDVHPGYASEPRRKKTLQEDGDRAKKLFEELRG